MGRLRDILNVRGLRHLFFFLISSSKKLGLTFILMEVDGNKTPPKRKNNSKSSFVTSTHFLRLLTLHFWSFETGFKLLYRKQVNTSYKDLCTVEGRKRVIVVGPFKLLSEKSGRTINL